MPLYWFSTVEKPKAVKASQIRRTSSLDTIYLSGHWPRAESGSTIYHGPYGPNQKHQSTQVDRYWTGDSRCFVFPPWGNVWGKLSFCTASAKINAYCSSSCASAQLCRNGNINASNVLRLVWYRATQNSLRTGHTPACKLRKNGNSADSHVIKSGSPLKSVGIRAIYRCTDRCKTWQSGGFPGWEIWASASNFGNPDAHLFYTRVHTLYFQTLLQNFSPHGRKAMTFISDSKSIDNTSFFVQRIYGYHIG